MRKLYFGPIIRKCAKHNDLMIKSNGYKQNNARYHVF